jgi:uncharacterized membrane protein YbaN (DUF454 family)
MERRPLSAPVRWLLLAFAGLNLVLGIVGLLLPVLPTVPFLLLAAWAAARSSPRLHGWLHAHPHFGPVLRDWQAAGVVPRRAKWMATGMMAASAASMLVVAPAAWLAAVLGGMAVMAAVLAWLWRRPEKIPG